MTPEAYEDDFVPEDVACSICGVIHCMNPWCGGSIGEHPCCNCQDHPDYDQHVVIPDCDHHVVVADDSMEDPQ